jgi:hypothetical protein
MGCLAALSCFISRLGERGLPLYPPLKEGQALHLDTRGRGSPRELKGTPY